MNHEQAIRMELDSFVLPPRATLPLLYKTDWPDVGALIGQIGTDEDWSSRTLSDVLELWNQLYEDYVAALVEPIKQAEEWFKQNGIHYATASPAVRAHYKREHTALTDARNRLHSILHSLYSQRMETLFAQAKQPLRQLGLTEEAVQGSEEFFNNVFQRPDYSDLGKKLPQLMSDLIAEYAKLEQAD